MADEIKISALPAVTVPVGTDEHAVVQGGITKKETTAQILEGGRAAIGIGSSTQGSLVVFADTGGLNLAQKDLTNGQIYIGYTGDSPVAGLPTNATNITWSGGDGTLTATLTGMAAQSTSAVAITGGSIDGTTLGNADSTQASARFVIPIATTIVASTTLNATHWSKRLIFNSPTAITITLPQQSTLATVAGVFFSYENIGAGLVTFIKEGSETLTGNTTVATNQSGYFYRDTTTDWFNFGGTAIVPDIICGEIGGAIVNQTYDISVRMPYAGTITGITTKSTTTSVAGTFTVAISGVNVTGLTTVANGASGVRTNTAATAANTFAIGDYITITFAGATITDMFWALAVTRNL